MNKQINKNIIRLFYIAIFCVILVIYCLLVKAFILFETRTANAPELIDVVAIYGDSRTNPDIHQKIVDQMLKARPEAVFNVGDLVDNPDDQKEWDMVKQIIKPFQDTSNFFVAAGNHEKESQLYYDNFNLPGNEKWYSWDKGEAHFIVLNTNLDISSDSEQYQWLENDLNLASSKKFKIVITHHPFLSVGQHEEENNNFSVELNNFLLRKGVSAVFSGHEHNYERFIYHDINYVITGGGGALLHDKFSDSEYLQKFAKVNNYCLLLIKENEITTKVFDIDGKEIDTFIIK